MRVNNLSNQKQLFQSGLTLYPLKNEKFRQINQLYWNNYTNCLNNYLKLFESKNLKPEAEIAVNSEIVHIKCRLCLSPDEQNIDTIVWKMRPFYNNENRTLQIIDPSQVIVIDENDQSLTLVNVRVDQSGEYLCELGNMHSPPYYLTVIEDHSLRLVHKNIKMNTSHASEDIDLNEFGLKILTKWKKWSECNVCGKVGRRFRLGFCTILVSNEKELEILSQIKGIKNEDIEILKMFPNGIPCSSIILPKAFKDISISYHKTNEIMIAFCKEKCNIQIVPWKNNNTSKMPNKNDLKTFMDLEKLKLKTPVFRKIKFVTEREDISFICPGNRNFQIPIRWRIDHNNYLIPKLLKEESNNRMNISTIGRFYLNNVQMHDSHYYSCWQGDDLTGTIKLVVEKPDSYDFEEYIAKFGLFALIFIFFLVLIRSFNNRKFIK